MDEVQTEPSRKARPGWRLSTFWQLQVGGWAVFGLLSMPMKLSVFGSLEMALWMTLIREPLGLLLTSLFRVIFRGLKLRLSEPGRLVVWVVPVCLAAAGLDVFLGVRAVDWMGSVEVKPSNESIWYFRSGIYMVWSFLFFWIPEYHASRARILALSRAETAAREAELLMLRAQVSPHFLFNAFNTILAEIDRRSESLSAVVMGLSDYFRYTLVNRNSAFVIIGEEYDALMNYFTVEKARFDDSLIVESRIDPAVRLTPVPGIFLQPLVENALKHGHRTSPTPLRVGLDVSAGVDGGILVEVSNSGSWIEPAVPRPGNPGGSGLSTLRRRLELLYPGAHRFSAGANAAGDGVVVRVELAALAAGVQ